MHLPEHTDDWLLEDAPKSDVVVSSRARVARNLPHQPFAPRASKEQLKEIKEIIEAALHQGGYFEDFLSFDLSTISLADRKFLRESHLISSEMEKGRVHRQVWIPSHGRTSIMINEEDHLRIQTLRAGFQVKAVRHKIEKIEKALESVLEFAYSPQFGYLTACPTNTGTGLRVSVMLHLVGLVMVNQVDQALESLGNFGLVVRGAYGEHSNHAGDLFQISNEVTLGKTEEELVDILTRVVDQLIEQEQKARQLLFDDYRIKCEDAIQRAIGVLSYARSIDSSEATTLLSRIRLGLDRDLGLDLTHEELNRLLIDVQPAHLRRSILQPKASTEDGNTARAAFLRAKFTNGGHSNQN